MKNKTRRIRHGAKGFTFVEVLLAVMILSCASLVIARVLSDSFRGMHRSHECYRASLSAENILWEIDRFGEAVSSLPGEDPNGWESYRWDFGRKKAWDGRLERICVTLVWEGSGGKEETLLFSSYHSP